MVSGVWNVPFAEDIFMNTRHIFNGMAETENDETKYCTDKIVCTSGNNVHGAVSFNCKQTSIPNCSFVRKQ